MQDVIQERVQAWCYGSGNRQAVTKAVASKLVYPLYAGVTVLALRSGVSQRAGTFSRLALMASVAKLGAKMLHATVINRRPFVLTGVPPLLDIEPDNGFPSDHALQVGALLASVYALRPSILPAFALSGALILVARLGAGVHHTADIVGGLALVGAADAATRAVPIPAGLEQQVRARIGTWKQRARHTTHTNV